MSIYPKFSSSSATFNSNDIQGNGDVQQLSINLSDYVTKSNPIANSDVYLNENVGINFYGDKQTRSYNEANHTKNTESHARTTDIEYNNNITKINNTLNLQSATVQFTDETIPISKVTDLTTTLIGIQTNLSNINNNDNDIANLMSTDTSHNNALTSHSSHLADHDTLLVDIENNVDLNKIATQNNLSNITTNSTDINNLQTITSNHDTSLNTHSTTLTTHTSLLSQADTNITNNTNTIINNKTLYDTRVSQVDTLLTNLADHNTTQDTNITVIDVSLNNHDISLTNIDSTLLSHSNIHTIHDTSINLLESDNTTTLTNVSNLQALTGSHTTSITTNSSTLTTHTGRLDNLDASVLTKNPIINNGNKLSPLYIGNGDVNALKLSTLNDINTNESIQHQINNLQSQFNVLDGLQDLDEVNIPALQSLTNENETRLDALDISMNAKQNIISDDDLLISHTSGLQSDLNAKNTSITNNTNSIITLNTNVNTLASADTVHDTQITNLTLADITLQTNVDAKQDIIDVDNKLTSSLVYDSTLSDTVDNILTTLDANVTTLDSSKQNAITSGSKLNTSLLNRDDNLMFVDVTGSIQGSINSINSNIALLQGVDTSIIDDIQDNFTTLDSSINEVITANTNNYNAISTLQSLQSGDVTSFNNINTSITNLTNTKQNLITSESKLNSSLLNRDDNLQYVDINSSLTSELSTLQTNIDTKQNIIDGSNKVSISNVNLGSHALSHIDIATPLQAQLTSINNSISSLSTADVNQVTSNTSFSDSINSLNTSVTSLIAKDTQIDTSLNTLVSDLNGIDLTGIANNSSSITSLIAKDIQIDTSLNTILSQQSTNVTNISTNTSDIATNVTNITTNASDIATNVTNISTNASGIATNSSGITALQSSVDAISSKIVPIDNTLNYTTPSNTLTHTYNAENIFLNTLDDNNVITMDLTITSPQNHKSYLQNVIIDCLEFKGYIHTLNINGSPVEIKYKDGDSAINLAPIAGYSTIIQSFNITRINDEWFVMSNVKLFYNSNSNSVYDVTPPIITLTGSANINYEINSGAYTDAGATANDNIGGDLTGSIVMDSSAVDVTTLGSYNVYFDVVDGAGNDAIQKIRVVNVIDTTNPVVVITGDVEKTQNQGYPYVEEGATASDNSNESLTVVITGSVDINVNGDYTLTYTATDSTGNTHALTRLIHIVSVSFALKYSNSSTDIISGLIGFTSYLNATPLSTQETFTITGNVDAYKNGDYITEVSNYHHDTARSFNYGVVKCFDNINTGGEFYAANVTSHGYYQNYPINHHVHGTLTMTNDSYRDTGSGYQYHGCNTNEIGLYHVSTTATNATTYDGEYVQITFPFHLELSRIDIYTGDSGFLFREGVMLGSADDGATWEYITTIGNGSSATAYDISVSTTLKYKSFRMVITQAEPNQGRMYLIRTFKLFGDVYSLI